MQQQLRITFRGMDRSDVLERRIRDKASDLECFYDYITSCHVTVEAPHQRHHTGNTYSVRVDLHVPGKEIVVGREHHDNPAHEDVYVAMRDAFYAAARQLEDYARRQRGRVKRHEAPLQGTVTKLFAAEGYGFVETSDGTEVYFHQNAVPLGGFNRLERGDPVRLVMADGEGERGPQASAVIPIGKHHPVAGQKAS